MPRMCVPPRWRRRIPRHFTTLHRWSVLHSFILPIIMGNKSLAQIDSTGAILLDAVRAVGVGLVFMWVVTPAPVQVLSIIMAIHFFVVVRAVWKRKPNAPEPGEEIWRMFYTLAALLVFRMLIQMTSSSSLPVLFVAGVFGWWEGVLMVRDMILTGTKFPPIIEEFTMAMFKLQSKRLLRWVKMLSEEDAEPEEKQGPSKAE